jgi:hypothetical protein
MGVYKMVHKNTFNYSSFKTCNTTHSSYCNFCMRQKHKAPSDNLSSAVLGKMRLLIPRNIKHAYGIITSKLPFLFLLL